MMLGFDKKKKTVDVNGKTIELQPKPSPISKIFGGGAKPAAPTTAPASKPPIIAPPVAPKPAAPEPAPKTVTMAPEPDTFASQQPRFQFKPTAPPPKPAAPTPPVPAAAAQQPKPVQPNRPYPFQFPIRTSPAQPKPQQKPAPTATPPFRPKFPMAPNQKQPGAAGPSRMPARLRLYIQKVASKHPDLENALRKEGIKESAFDFVKRMLMFAIIFTVSITAVAIVMLDKILHNPVTAVVLSLAVGFAAFMSLFNSFLNFPTAKGRASSKKVERDILFAARDLIIALRSGMPLFNAITSVSSGYGEASKEFLKIVERVQLGTPLEDAIDDIVAETKSGSFRKIMLQASVSIRVGADVTSALQSVIDQLSQERVIELRRYGQRLNAIAMFYMLFGIILPSMGIAVLTILTTFIPIFSVDITLLEVVIVGLVFLQVVFLQMIRTSRPVFTM